MATMLPEIGARLVSAVPGLVLASTLFLGQEPDSPDTCVTLIAGPGGEPEWTMGAQDGVAQVPVYEPHRLQALVRAANTATSYTTAEAQAWLIYRALSLTNVTLTGTRYLLIEPVAVPAPLEQDSQSRITFVVNFRVLREATS